MKCNPQVVAFMTPFPYSIDIDAPLGDARTMADNHIGSAIVTKNEKLVGIFTVTDACRALAQVLDAGGAETNLVA